MKHIASKIRHDSKSHNHWCGMCGMSLGEREVDRKVNMQMYVVEGLIWAVTFTEQIQYPFGVPDEEAF
jgi:hypothetical protein